MALTTTLPGYETVILTRNEMTDDALRTLKDRLGALFTQFGGEVVLTEDWGKRRLAYPVQKEIRGHYTYIVYTGRPGVVSEVERTLRIQDHVLRYLTVALDREFDKEQFKKQRANQVGRTSGGSHSDEMTDATESVSIEA